MDRQISMLMLREEGPWIKTRKGKFLERVDRIALWKQWNEALKLYYCSKSGGDAEENMLGKRGFFSAFGIKRASA